MISDMYVSIFITNEQLNYHWELPNDRQFLMLSTMAQFMSYFTGLSMVD